MRSADDGSATKTRFGRALLSVLVTVLIAASATAASFAQHATATSRDKPTLAPLVRRVAPAVVSISAVVETQRERDPLLDDPIFHRFFNDDDLPSGPVLEQSAGSGVIINARAGYVVTNYHLVANAREITATLADGRTLGATLIGGDAETDIALLRVDGRGLSAVELGDSDNVEVGDYVVAIGDPFGLGHTVTSGIVSALGRADLGIEGYEDFIQTDASINPGNSGGALVDLDGRLIGINSAMLSTGDGGGNVGIAFAIPSNVARAVIGQILQYGEMHRGRLGLIVEDLTAGAAAALGLGAQRGAVVTDIEPGSAAESAGIAPGDIVTALDGKPIVRAAELRNRVGLLATGQSVTLDLLRDGRRVKIEARLRDRPADTELTPAPP